MRKVILCYYSNMLYDCFALWNVDLLEIRLNILKDVVDEFVICEAGQTFTGNAKPFNFETNKERFAEFLPRIRYVKVVFPPEIRTAFEHESYQRNQMAAALASARPDDWVMVSDMDEIPSPDALRAAMRDNVITVFEQRLFHYFLNNESYKKWCGPVLFQHKNLKKIGTVQDARNHVQSRFEAIRNNRRFPYFIKTELEIAAMRYIRHMDIRVAENSGWHFSFIGGVQKVRDKLRAYTDEKWATAADDEMRAEEMIYAGINVGTGEKEFHRVEIDDSFPAYIRNNQEKFKDFILAPRKSD